jgi:hypothetical protein
LAIEYFNDAISQNPKNCSYYVYRAVSQLAKKNMEAATEDAMRILQIQPNWPKVSRNVSRLISSAKPKKDWLFTKTRKSKCDDEEKVVHFERLLHLLL